jgi:hypothetical protein
MNDASHIFEWFAFANSTYLKNDEGRSGGEDGVEQLDNHAEHSRWALRTPAGENKSVKAVPNGVLGLDVARKSDVRAHVTSDSERVLNSWRSASLSATRAGTRRESHKRVLRRVV